MSTLPWLDGIVKWDPDKLSRLEYFLGPFDIDWDGGEASGVVIRPQLRAGAPIGGVRREVRRVAVAFWLRGDETFETGARNLDVASLALDLDLARTEVVRHLANRFATTSAIVRDGRTLTAYGDYLLDTHADGSTHLEWSCEQPEWAMPAHVEGALAALLELLLDRMICGGSPHGLYAALLPATGGTGCHLSPPAKWGPRSGNGVTLLFHPPIAIDEVARALRLDGYAGAPTRIGVWDVDATIGADARVHSITVSPYPRP